MSERLGHKLKRLLPALLHRAPALERNLNYVWPYVINGKRFIIPIEGGLGEGLLRIEPDFKSELFDCIRKLAANAFVDVGANIGQTIVEAFSVASWQLYLALEPSLECASYLTKLLALNDLGNIFLLPWASGSEASPLVLRAASVGDASATLSSGRSAFMPLHTLCSWVSVYTLDQSLAPFDLPKNFFLKIDVEGCEAAVLDGAVETLSCLRPLVLCEVLRAYAKDEVVQVSENMSKLEALLTRLSYTILGLKLSNETSGQILELERLRRFPRDLYQEAPSGIDYLFVPNEQMQALSSLLPWPILSP